MRFSWVLAALVGMLSLADAATAGGPYIGFSFGYRAPVYRPYYYPYPYYYRPYVVVEPPPPAVYVQPAYVQPAPVYVQPAVTAAPAVPAYSSPAPTISQTQPPPSAPNALPPITQATTVSATTQRSLVQQLDHPDENARREAALELGRNRAADAIDPLCNRLASDASAQVREASARALGMIGSTRGMSALQRAAVGDSDSLVRHTSQFALDIIHSNQRR